MSSNDARGFTLFSSANAFPAEEVVMETRNEDVRARKSFWSAPLLCSLLLLLGIGFALYSLYSLNALSSLADNAEVQRQLTLNSKLADEKTALEALKGIQPCEARQWLLDHGFSAPASVVPAPPSSASTPATAAPTAPTQPPPADAAKPASAADAAPAPSTTSVVDALEDATVFVLAASDSQMSMGSGFFIAPDLVLTNRHVIESTSRNIIIINKKLKRVVRATLVAASDNPRRDYAVLRVELPQGISVTPLPLGPLPRRATKVSAWGYPHAITKDDPKYQALVSGMAQAAPELVYTDGVVSAVLERTPPLIVHTAPLSPGSSGGPLANEQGQVVGINTLISLDEDSYRQTSIALPSTDIRAFLREKGIEVQ